MSNDNELIFYEYLDGMVGEKILSIKVVKRNDFDREAKNKGYKLLYDNGQIIYAFQLSLIHI